MDRRVPKLAEQLLLIERELRLLGGWESSPPSAESLASAEPFCVDTLAFDQWLQWIFLPRMKQILEQGKPLPTVSGVLAMAEMVYQHQPQRAAGLFEALDDFDKLISQG